ncbi:conserved hypothetical protein [Candidatus Terasakiella magnetica]|nr:conserved hypothetical protein [Candidatus Terasakiella magnetica]
MQHTACMFAAQPRPAITLSQILPLSRSSVAASLPRRSAFAFTIAFVKFFASFSIVRIPASCCRAFKLE